MQAVRLRILQPVRVPRSEQDEAVDRQSNTEQGYLIGGDKDVKTVKHVDRSVTILDIGQPCLGGFRS
jgi:Tfp pilus assembly protein FimT